MKKIRKGYTMFRTVELLTRGLLLGCYFLAAGEILEEVLGNRSLPVTFLYLVTLETGWILLEAWHVEQRRLLDLVYGQFFGALCANVFFGGLLYTLSSLSLENVLPGFFLLTLLEAGLGMFWAAAFFQWYLKNQSYKKALFIYGEREDPALIQEENNRMNGYFKIVKAVHYREGLPALEAWMEKYEAVYLGDIPTQTRNELLKRAVGQKIACYSVPKVSDIYLQNANILRLHDKVLFQYPSGGLTRGQEFRKRLLDLLGAALLLAGFLPIMVVIACCIKAEDGGPIFYRQERITKNGRTFRMLKFRSMQVNAELDGARLAQKGDSRITRTGNIIRNLHFDELPQLFNVLKGEMSLVGPRPERREFMEEYSRIIPEFKERLKVRGGLTGYAQIYGKYNTGPEDKIKYDFIYIYNYSLRLDIRLLFLTVRILFQKENTEGVEPGQRSAVKQKNGER